MNLTRTLVGAVAAAGLVVAGGVAGVAPAGATPTATDKTNISLKKDTVAEFVDAGVTMTAINPAKRNGTKLMFPVEAFGTTYLDMSGGLSFSGPSKATMVFTAPIMSWRKSSKTGTMTFNTAALGRVALINVKYIKQQIVDVKIDKSHARWIKRTTYQITGTMNFTSRSSTLNYINDRLGTDMFEPGLGLGRFKSVVVDEEVCAVNNYQRCMNQ